MEEDSREAILSLYMKDADMFEMTKSAKQVTAHQYT